MRNKKLYLLLGLMLTALVSVAGSFASAVTFNIELESLPTRKGYMTKNMIPIHFKDNDNDFGGFIYFSNGITTEEEESENIDPYEITIKRDGNVVDAIECWQQVKGFYYNAERGERLWPLDSDSLSATNNDYMTGGLYTRCRSKGYMDALTDCLDENNQDAIEACEEGVRNEYADTHGYYGIVQHSYDDQYFALVAGVDYKKSGNWVEAEPSGAATLIRFDNKYPVGFIYDSNGGAGFLGCKIEPSYGINAVFTEFSSNQNQKDRNNLFALSSDGIVATGGLTSILDCSNKGSAKNSLISVIVDGLVGINTSASGNIGIQGNQGNEKMQYFSLVDINNMQLINYAKQKAETLCRGKWQINKDNPNLDGSINCISGGFGTIDAPVNKTLIVKGRTGVVKPMRNFESSGYYDIFVDGGNLLIDDSAVSPEDLSVFKKNGFISGTGLADFNNTVRSVWTNYDDEYSGDEIVAGKFIKGNFIVNGNIKSADSSGLNNVYFIYGKMTSKDTVKDLEKVFTWNCQGGTGSDGNACPLSRELSNELYWDNPYENAALVIIDQNYPSPLYQ